MGNNQLKNSIVKYGCRIFMTGFLLFTLFVLNRCNKGEIIYTTPAPVVSSNCRYDIITSKVGEDIAITPYIENANDAVFLWQINGITVGNDKHMVYKAAHSGTYHILFTVSTDFGETELKLTLYVSDEKGFTNLRPNSSVSVDTVFEYLPAPGQFINDPKAGFNGESTMQEACRYALTRFNEGTWISLGGFGGYITAGFDHSIYNDKDYNIEIAGNAIKGSSEPGIVWVMQDKNGNGLPDDIWYELKGSEYKQETTLHNYAVTYYKPSDMAQSVKWTDSNGKSDSIDYLESHTQDYYYPLWVDDDSYILKGVRLESKNYEQSANNWVNDSYDWGYADNAGDKDSFSNSLNHFKIDDAVDAEGNPVALQFIDFVKVQTGVNAKSGRLGELSTEVVDIRDYNLIK